ncbi:NADP-dependent oxidoreductase [Chitinophaga qingshengii]|uniref:NADP-dependent oxidoreductase n=1 Tax=Chitinophaga qingshengii TaxID=1569794 RepID=A0ABR7TS86_9BACT|nr:NADP-dependent oxidoreductase [Chitinophaga qingshengii]MBC9933350.1 NADP-dependent oxidoreductase [Chitinophaga qingshengii]
MKIQQILLNERPEGLPTADTFKTVTTELPAPANGEVLLQPLYFSVDPYMRGRMSDARSYIPPFRVREPIESGGVATVVESKDPRFTAGDLVMPGGGRNFFPWATGILFPGDHLRKIDGSISPSYYLGVLGMPGLTAYFGLMDIGKPKAGETVVISGAAGAVGLVAGQIARLQGCRVVGIAGGEEKVKMLTGEFNFDAAINYKDNKHLDEAIAAACPNGVDIYFDNVGGEISDAVMQHLNFFARIPVCGQIALYNSTEVPMGPRVQPTLIKFSVLMQGFTIGNYAPRYGEGMQQLGEWIRAGKIKYAETVIEGFDQLPTALLGLFSGKNSGKMIVKV